MSKHLFDRSEFLPPVAEAAETEPAGVPRLRIPSRNQVEMRCASLDELLDRDHPVRFVWAAVEQLNLEGWLEKIQAVEGHVGRNATDPRLLLALWVYATIDAVGSARRLNDLCDKHIVYKWLCGGVTVNYHMLATFRWQNEAAFDAMITQIVASLMAEDLVKLIRVAQDGLRVRAHAGKSSFRGIDKLRACREEARAQVEALKKHDDESKGDHQKRQRAAQQRAAEERLERLNKAIQHCEQLQAEKGAGAKKSGRKETEARASTTDPEARIMKFANGGFDPGYNVQIATDVDSKIIVDVGATNAGNDFNQAAPMLDQLKARYGITPREALYDGGYATQHTLEGCTAHGVEPYMPLKQKAKQIAAGKDPYARKKGDNDDAAAWRHRMGTPKAAEVYPLRAQTAEWINARVRNWGLRILSTCGQVKCRITALLHAITHNLLIAGNLRAEAEQERATIALGLA